jgi:ADP-ribosyl-[dinitrogen reductase] hydrolase
MMDPDRQRGALIGLAVGDALGAAVEFLPPGTFEPVTDYRTGGPHGLAPGEWTDDTSMALALADSIATVGWDLDDQAQRYVAWWKTGKYSVTGECFDIGITTRSALGRWLACRDARQSADSHARASGNGSIMRLAPVAIAYGHWLPQHAGALVERLMESSLPTHASPQCRWACAYLGLILAGLMHGMPRDELLGPHWPPVNRLNRLGTLDSEIAQIAAGSFRGKQPPAIRGGGYVVHSLEAALWAFHDAQDFSQAVLKAVNLGDDADTTGAVCGQLAGAYWGESGIPAAWRMGLAQYDTIGIAVTRLIEAAKAEVTT